MGVEDGELVALVLEIEDQRRIGNDEIEAVGARRRVDTGDEPLGGPVTERDQAAGLVRCLLLRVPLELQPQLGGDYHQGPCSIAAPGSCASQKSPERYFQPPSARIATTTPSSSSSARRRATWTTAPDETPA